MTLTAPDYTPATDRAFVDDVVNTLRDHQGEWIHPGRVVLSMRGAECEAIILAEYTYKAVQVARRLGDVIEGDRVLGYRYVGFRRVCFTSLEWASRWPDVPAEDRPHRRWRPPREQMTLQEAMVG